MPLACARYTTRQKDGSQRSGNTWLISTDGSVHDPAHIRLTCLPCACRCGRSFGHMTRPGCARRSAAGSAVSAELHPHTAWRVPHHASEYRACSSASGYAALARRGPQAALQRQGQVSRLDERRTSRRQLAASCRQDSGKCQFTVTTTSGLLGTQGASGTDSGYSPDYPEPRSRTS